MRLSKTSSPSTAGEGSQRAAEAASDLPRHTQYISFHVKKPSVLPVIYHLYTAERTHLITCTLEWTGAWTQLPASPAVPAAQESCESGRRCPLNWD